MANVQLHALLPWRGFSDLKPEVFDWSCTRLPAAQTTLDVMKSEFLRKHLSCMHDIATLQIHRRLARLI